MVRFVDKPYVTKAVGSKISSIKWKMACGIGMTGLHFITLSDNGKDLFDIYPAAVFKQKSIRKSDRVIVGIADNYTSATGLIETMINDCLNDRGDLSDIRGYFEQYIKDHL
ncbi:MAG: hypothetical protein K6F87_06380 [Lachnospiraceae bacterium]|nr:hypothetical protein [Lachnospiraceae bacterium]